MDFISVKHIETYDALQAKAQMSGSCEFRAALYVLAAIGKDLRNYVRPEAILFKDLLQKAHSWSSCEKALVKLAATLFNGSAFPVYVGRVFYPLDETNTKVALEALKIRYRFQDGKVTPEACVNPGSRLECLQNLALESTGGVIEDTSGQKRAGHEADR